MTTEEVLIRCRIEPGEKFGEGDKPREVVFVDAASGEFVFAFTPEFVDDDGAASSVIARVPGL